MTAAGSSGQPLRVCHVITGLERGGAETALLRLLQGLDRRAFLPSVISLTGPGALGDAVADSGAALHCLGWRRGRPPLPWQLLHLSRVLRAEAPGLVQTWLYHADLAGLLAARLAGGPPVLWNIRCSDMDFDNYGRGTRLTVRLAARLSQRPAGVVVNSAAGQQVHEALGYRPRAWHLIPNGIDTGRFRPDREAGLAWCRTAGIPLPQGDAPPLIGHVARLDPQKDHEGFLQALAMLAGRGLAFRAVLAGRGTPGLAGRVAELGIGDRLHLLGEQAEMPAMMAALDLFCMSSAYGEGFPNVLAEAMACGVPAVATDVGDAGLILDAPHRLVAPRDPVALAAALEGLLRLDGATRRQLGAADRARIVGTFTLDRSVARYAALYAATGAGAPGPGASRGRRSLLRP